MIKSMDMHFQTIGSRGYCSGRERVRLFKFESLFATGKVRVEPRFGAAAVDSATFDLEGGGRRRSIRRNRMRMVECPREGQRGGGESLDKLPSFPTGKFGSPRAPLEAAGDPAPVRLRGGRIYVTNTR